jgi:hypothetical protein
MRQLSGIIILAALALLAIAFYFRVGSRRRPRRGREDTLRGDLDDTDRDDV